tara:strand:+ start:1148 stop:2110 length:963 start_codon:yes stop_codon:yes gene_type:complete
MSFNNIKNLITTINPESNYLTYQKNEINYFFNNINMTNINILIDKIKNQKNNIYFIGCGKSYNIALQSAELLKSISFNTFVLCPTKMLHGDIGCINNNLIILYSKSGNTKEIINIIPYLKNRNCFIVGVSCQKGNMYNLCDLNIILPFNKEIDKFNLIPSISYTLYTLFLNILVENLSKTISLEDYGNNHPSGDIGKKSNINLIDIMRKKDDCCFILDKNISIRECLIKMTNCKCQCSIFLDGNKLDGIVTDYDIKNYLIDNDNINEKINSLINKNPYTLNNTDKLIKIKDIKGKHLSGIPILDINTNNFLGLIDNKSII